MGPNSEIRMLKREVRFGLKNRPRQPRQSGPKSAGDRTALGVPGLRGNPHVLWIGWGNLWRYERLHSVHDTFRV